MTEPADLNVDELRRRARRRLVGAIVLALAAAVVVPMLLESEPRPLGEDVSVKIPPIDDGKFVNRLNDSTGNAKAAKGDAAKAAATPAAPNAAREPASAQPAPKSAPAAQSKVDNVTDSSSTTTPLPATDAPKPIGGVSTTAPTASTGMTPNAEPSPAPAAPKDATSTLNASTAKPSPVAPDPSSNAVKAEAADGPQKSVSAARTAAEPVKAAAARTEAPKEGFSVQLAAFSDDKGANALANRLKRAGYAAYTEPLKTSKGILWRVRVGPFASRDAASVMRDRLKGDGQSGIVAPAH